jgi:hypothetical protein
VTSITNSRTGGTAVVWEVSLAQAPPAPPVWVLTPPVLLVPPVTPLPPPVLPPPVTPLPPPVLPPPESLLPPPVLPGPLPDWADEAPVAPVDGPAPVPSLPPWADPLDPGGLSPELEQEARRRRIPAEETVLAVHIARILY